jgi:hypothetical protein
MALAAATGANGLTRRLPRPARPSPAPFALAAF